MKTSASENQTMCDIDTDTEAWNTHLPQVCVGKDKCLKGQLKVGQCRVLFSQVLRHPCLRFVPWPQYNRSEWKFGCEAHGIEKLHFPALISKNLCCEKKKKEKKKISECDSFGNWQFHWKFDTESLGIHSSQ